MVVSSGLVTAQATPAAAADPAFTVVTLAKGSDEVGEPMTLAVLPDRSVLHTSRGGEVRLTDAAGNTKLAGTIPVYTHDEEGLQGVALDPGFATNRFVFFYYAPPLSTPADEDAPEDGTPADWAPFVGVNRLSRFVLTPEGTLDMASETTILDVESDRGVCCHMAGDMDFDADGNLYLATGDDTKPWSSGGFTPIDEQPTRNPVFDAQRSSGNTNDLRGKILRIKVNPDGTYSIPPGNLFPPGTDKTRPEIYAMGFRNPFRISVDKPTGALYVAENSADSDSGDPTRGPQGLAEFLRITEAGNHGWPYCVGKNEPYFDFQFPDGPAGPAFNCAAPVNDSPRNTGLTELPPAQPAWIDYGWDSFPPFGEGGESPTAGPVYRYDADNPSDVKFPASYDGKFFAGEFNRGWIKPIAVNPDGSPGAIEDFDWPGEKVMDQAFGPDGALYVLDYGTGFFGGTAESALYRIEYVTGNRAPTAIASATPTSGPTPLSVTFTGSTSADPDGDALTYAWDFDNNGTTDSTEADPTHVYTGAGTFAAKLTVTDPDGASGTANVTVSAGNTRPTVTLTAPVNGAVVAFGDTVPFSVTVSDPEDGAIDCSRVTVTYILGHDSHGHPQSSTTGCSGSITTGVDGGHGEAANVFGVWSATYTDDGGLQGTAQVRTQQPTQQAEYFTGSSGVQVVARTNAHGARAVGDLGDEDWISFTPYDLTGITGFTARVSATGAGGRLELRSGSATGTLVGSVTVPDTGNANTFATVSGTVPGAVPGTEALYLVGAGSSPFDLDEFTLTRGTSPGPGVDLTPGSTATASTTENDDPDRGPAKAVDGDPTTRWASQQGSDTESITVDLGEPHTVSRVKLTWEAAFASGYSIRTSADGQTWRPASYSTTTGNGDVDDVTFASPAPDTRYVRIDATARGSVHGYSLWEVQIFGDGDGGGPDPEPDGYTPLFDGSTTTGWTQAGPGSFTVGADATLTSTGGMGLLWYSARQFGSYSLKLDWRMTGDSNSGIFVGFPAAGNDPYVAIDNGYEIQIDATDSPDRTTGAVYGVQGADTEARDAALKPPGEWNTYEIVVEGQVLTVLLNGVKINEFTNTDPDRDLTQGHIGLQNHGDDDVVSFRDVRIKELPAP